MFKGSLSQMNLSEVIRLLVSSNQSGALILSEPSSEKQIAILYLQAGTLSSGQTAQSKGLDALNEICTFLDAAFEFHEALTSSEKDLEPYPLEKLLESVQKRITQIKSLNDSMPDPSDVLFYQSGTEITGIDASPDDLTLLLLCDGYRRVEEVAKESGRDLDEVINLLAKFRQVGLIGVVVEEHYDEALSQEESDVEAPSYGKNYGKKVRYWRGKRIEG